MVCVRCWRATERLRAGFGVTWPPPATLKADPSRAVSVDRVKARLAAVHKKTTAKA